MLYEDHQFRGETLRLDDNQFRRCTFERCTFLYSGAEGGEISGCSFVDTPVLHLIGAASRTIDTLRTFHADPALRIHAEQAARIILELDARPSGKPGK